MASDRELTEFRGRINNLAVVEYAAVDGMVDNNTPNPRQDITTIRKCHDYVPDFFKAVPVILSSVQFCLNRIAIIHYAAEVAHITGVLADRIGPVLGSFLNITNGNAPEAFVLLIALARGDVEVVEDALVGSVLVNNLLVYGLAKLVGGIKHGVQSFNRAVA